MTTVDPLGDARVDSPIDPIAQLTGPGAPFEIVVDDVVGHPMQVYKNRMQSLRELMAQNAARADVDWLVQGDRRLTYGEHDLLARRLARSLAAAGCRARRSRRARVGERARVGRHLVGVRHSRRHSRAAERVVEGRGARVRSRRLGRQGADRRRPPARDRPRPARGAARARTRLRHRRPGRRDRAFVLRAGRGHRRSRDPRLAHRRGRHPRDPLHVGDDRQAQGCDRVAPSGDRERAEHHRDGCRAGDARYAAAGSRSGAADGQSPRRAACST